MKIESVCERLKIWVERGMAQQVTLHISPEGSIQVERMAKIKNESDLNKESIKYPADYFLMEPEGKVKVKII